MKTPPLPGLGAPMQGADAGPIESGLNPLMNAIANTLDDVFNGPDCKAEDRKVWFFLAAGSFAIGDQIPETNRFNYISNADRLNVRAVLREVLARLEARLSAEGRA